ncbi:MAG: vWA domain-containing protein [Pirellulales bacterium]
MSFECPAWLQHWLGVGPGSTDESVLARIELLRPMSSTATLAIFVIAAVAVFYCYARASEAGRAYRMTLAVLRLLVVAVILAMLGELSITLRRAGLPNVLVLVDDSESMKIADRYADPEFAKRLTERVAADLKKRGTNAPTTSATSSSEAAGPSRIETARMLLLENDAAFLRRLAEQNYQLRMFAVSDAARLLPLAEDALRAELAGLPAVGKTTRLGDGLRTALDELRGQPIAAVVLISDGVNTSGVEPAETAASAAQRNVHLYTIGLGETKKALNVELAELKTRDSVMVNDLVSFDFTVAGSGAEGASVELVLREADSVVPLAKKTIRLGKDDAGQAVRLTHRPEKTGTIRYTVETKPLVGEISEDDNRLEAVVEVRTDKIKVLLVQSYPSFEYRYLKHMLGRDETVKLHCVLQEADQDYPRIDASVTTIFPVTFDELLEYDVVIFGDVDPEFLGASAVEHLRNFVLEKGRGIIFSAGPAYMPSAYRGTALAELLPIDFTRTAAGDEPSPARDGTTVRLTPDSAEEPIFQLDDTSAESRKVWENLPLLYWVLDAEKRKSAQVMVEAVDADNKDGEPLPVVLFQRAGRGMVLFHATDETWRWRRRVGDHYFARYWVQALRQLAMGKGNNRPAVLRVAKDEYDVGKPVVVEVRYQDERTVPADGNVEIVIESEGRPNQTVQLARRRNLRDLFEAAVSGLPEGKYTARLATPVTDSTDAGTSNRPAAPPSDEFEVLASQMESGPIEADHATLKAAAAAGKGAFFTVADLDQLWNVLPRGKLSPTEPLPPVGLWNKWYAIFVLTLLLCAEWILRKRRAMV